MSVPVPANVRGLIRGARQGLNYTDEDIFMAFDLGIMVVQNEKTLSRALDKMAHDPDGLLNPDLVESVDVSSTFLHKPTGRRLRLTISEAAPEEE